MANNPSEISETAINEAKEKAQTDGVAQMVFSPDGSKYVIVTSAGAGQILDTSKSGGNS